MQTAFEQYFTGLKGKKIAVLGLGVSNRPLVRLLLEFGCDVTGCDRTPREKLDAEVLELESAGCKLKVGENYLEGVEADVLFRTPACIPPILPFRLWLPREPRSLLKWKSSSKYVPASWWLLPVLTERPLPPP